MTATFDNFTSEKTPLMEQFAPKTKEGELDYNLKVLDSIFAAAKPGAVFSAPVVSGNYTVITASEISTGGGFGSGKGFGPVPAKGNPTTNPSQESPASEADQAANTMSGGGGMGGGGGASGRPLAVIMIGPDGVKVQPIVDPTKIMLAAFTVFGTIFVTMLKMRRAAKRA